ncbi:hypothetical protein EIP91_008729 [Steccherinum ochraceum]|uniref:DUF590-domain-containing protein n=1 Tax=Steccherinum ochraceum TaxID=92696 RepID=A0A4V2MX85_9APHY|nr:hypothetical protein EIP91_008729 [Steccherinum ochraceum]
MSELKEHPEFNASPDSGNLMAPVVDLVVVFRSTAGKAFSKAQARQNIQAADQQYRNLLDALRKGGLRAVGKRGEREGQLLVLVSCPPTLLKRLAQRERHTDFLSGLPSKHSIGGEDLESTPLCPADHLRLIHSYVTATEDDGGLGVAPLSKEWDRVESVMALHDHLFNDTWIRSWTTRQLGFPSFGKLKEQFGESVALYFAFLSAYTKALIFISAVGVYFYFFAMQYSTVYSSILVLWSITFVEWWRIKQRVLSVQWGTRGSFRVEKRRAHYAPIPWWKRDLRAVASLPVILLFVSVLAVLLTGIFVFEAFVTQLYKGPGHRLAGFAPTALFVALVPKLLSVYQIYAVRLTNWENHGHQSTHDASLTIKTFTLSAVVAYLGLALSAFVYVPFGEEVMYFVQTYLFHRESPLSATAKGWSTGVLSTIASSPTARAVADKINDTIGGGSTGTNPSGQAFWETDGVNARSKLNPSRLQDQMFAFTVTNQVVNTFLEIGLPFVLRAVASVRNGKGLSFSPGAAPNGAGAGGAKKKRVMFEDEASESEVAKNANGKEEREFMERVRREVALPEYTLFADYSEMVTQFGYVALWSTIWPLAPVMSLINNWLELRSDAFKITVHTRRPIPSRSDTIGPWLDSLTFLTWLAALTNSSLVYLFRPSDQCKPMGTSLSHKHHHLASQDSSTKTLLFTAMLVALAASHGYMIVRVLVRHVLERVLWKGSREERESERLDSVVKKEYLKTLGVADVAQGVEAEKRETKQVADSAISDGEKAFWEFDEGLQELEKGIKDA